ncbi:NAD(P)/FAD-dependent oxidoreductase [Halococcus agarilyticus]|uniref:NAD(P)/FAD-dependent oxidoreductase n=1 Tax=Halococcus agarilyticus TaxID=1232219 RepID=UPI000677F0B3|nr:FAD-binding oxidoreductase [Halococcus agarilyticus]
MSAEQTQTADVIVVGGGVAGIAIARDLAADHDVAVIEKGQVAAEASGLAAGLIGLRATYPEEPAISDHAAAFFESYDGTGQFAYERREYVRLVPSDAAVEIHREANAAGDGHAGTFRTPAELRERYRRLNADGFAGGVEYDAAPGHGWLDPFTFAATLQDDAEARGATVHTETPVTDLLVEGGEVVGVETPDTTFRAPTVVVAAGWWTPRLLDGIVELPIRPYRTQCLVLDPGEDVSDLPMGSLPEEHVYWRPERNGDLLVGGWSFAVEEPAAASRSEDEGFRDHVARVVPRIFEGMDGAGFVDGWAGVDAATPDTIPVIDAPADAPDGLVVATGFHGRGVMTAPVTATAVRSLVTDADAPFPLDPFRVNRFESRSPDFEFRSISATE